ncbi:S8 family peptidase [Candidatus Woesearchaeota archaeon]|nr:S8 family peptidase [Candidatus Woesearchaeota archaeon]
MLFSVRSEVDFIYTPKDVDVYVRAELYAEKLDEKTREYFAQVKKDEQEDYLIKYKVKKELKNVTIKEEYGRFALARIEGEAGAVSLLLLDKDIEYIELDQNVTVLGEIPYGVNLTLAPLAWNATNGSGVKVGLLDTGIASHDDLSLAGGVSFVSEDYGDTYGHGTLIAGVLAAVLDGEGIVGVAPSVSLYAVKIANGSTGKISDAISGLEWAIENDMDIVSMSFGMEGYSQIFKEVLEDAYDNDIVLIAASGNTGGSVVYPAAYSDVIAVGAVNENLEKAPFSSSGSELELVAGGVDINSTFLNNTYNVSSGTSFAAPHVAGVACLLRSYNSSWTNDQIRGKLQNDALDLGIAGKDDEYGYGLVRINLTSTDFSLGNASYPYEIFNITDYGTENQTLHFWLNGTGTIDDVEFMEGYYQIVKYLEEIINQTIYVGESGSIVFLFTEIHLDAEDDYTNYGNAGDGVVWVDGDVDFECDECVEDELQVACYSFDSSDTYVIPFEFDKCWGNGTGSIGACSSGDGDLADFCDSNPSDCSDTGVEDSHDYPNSLLDDSTKRYFGVIAFWDCGDAGNEDDDDYDSLYIIDALNSSCLTNSTWRVRGRFNSNFWINVQDLSCDSSEQCDPYRAGVVVTDESYQYETSDGGANDVCRTKDGFSCSVDDDCLTGHFCVGGVCSATQGEVCNGTLNIVTSNSDLNVEVNSVHEGQTDVSQFIQKEVSNVCGNGINVSVICSNNQTLCHSETVYVNNDGETVTVVDSNCIKTCDADPNFWLTNEDVSVKGSTINVTIHSSDLNGTVNVSLHRVNRDTGLIDDTKSLLLSIDSFSTASGTTTWDLNSASALNVYIDEAGAFNESKSDNFVYRLVSQNVPRVYLSINTSYLNVNSLIEGFLEQYVDSVSEGEAELVISVGRFTSEFKNYNQNTLIIDGKPVQYTIWGYENSRIVGYGRRAQKSYAGIVGRTLHVTQNKPLILAYGIDVDGDIAAIKKLISARANMFSDLDSPYLNPLFLDDYDRLGLGIDNLLPRNVAKNSSAYLSVVNKILFDNIFDVAIRTVKTLNETSYGEETILRLKNVNADYSEDFKDAISESDKPVTFSGGIFSNLVSWENNDGLARELADEGRDVWEIEMSGGPTTECELCPNYTYYDQVDYYWPALIGGVQIYTGKDSMDYVSHSNGGRVALSSLHNYPNGKSDAGYFFNLTNGQYESADLKANPIDIFVGVAIPVTLNDDTLFTTLARGPLVAAGRTSHIIAEIAGDYAMQQLSKNEKYHLNLKDYAKYLNPIGNFFPDDGKISSNLMNFYNELAINESSSIDLSNVNVSELYLFNGKPDDKVLGAEDQSRILDSVGYGTGTNITSNWWDLINYGINHVALISDESVISAVKEALK